MPKSSQEKHTTLKFRKIILGEISKQNPLRFGTPTFCVPFEDSEEHIKRMLVETTWDGKKKYSNREETVFAKLCGRWEEFQPFVFDKNEQGFHILEPKLGLLRNGTPIFMYGHFILRQKDSGMFPFTTTDFPHGRRFLIKMFSKARDGLFERFSECPEFIPDFMTTLQSYWKSKGAQSGYFNHSEMCLFVNQLKNLDFAGLSTFNQVSKAIDRTGFHLANQKGLSSLVIQVVMGLGLTRDQWFEELLTFLFEKKKYFKNSNFEFFMMKLIYGHLGENIQKIYEEVPASLKK